MEDIMKVVFGAAIGFLVSLLGETIKRRRLSQVAAMMIIRELDYHSIRLHQAVQYDNEAACTYSLKLPTDMWDGQSAHLLAGCRPSKVEALLNWYSTLRIVGNQLGKQRDEEGEYLIGPDRQKLITLLKEARSATFKIASFSIFWTYKPKQNTIFDLSQVNNSQK